MSAISRERALSWLQGWDRQQDYYMPDREERYDVIGDVLEHGLDRTDAVVVDLGIGPGSLAARLLDRFPAMTVVGIDEDPLLLRLAESAYGGDRLRTVRADLRTDDWYARLGLERTPDAYVSSTALHWLNREALRRVLSTCGRTIAPGGVFVNADHLYEGSGGERLDALLRRLTAQRLEPLRTDDSEDWAAWWMAIEQDPELAEAVRERDGGFDHTVTDRPSVHDYLDFLRASGFAEAGIVWQFADDRVIAALS